MYTKTPRADVARQLGELTVAEGLAERAIAKLNDADDTGGLAAALLASGRVSLLIGDDERAASTLGRAVELSRANCCAFDNWLAAALKLRLASSKTS